MKTSLILAIAFILGFTTGGRCQSSGGNGSLVPLPSGGGQPPVQPVRECTRAGRICATCDTVAVCIATGVEGFETILQSCPSEQHCSNGFCSDRMLCNYRPFECMGPGYYPDPYDCTKYHICLPGSPPYELTTGGFTCGAGTSYNPSSQDCTLGLRSAACRDRPVAECDYVLQTGPVEGDDSLYYVCIVKNNTLAPELRRCPGGRHFDANKLSCLTSSPTPTIPYNFLLPQNNSRPNKQKQ